jgi:hypothetical protein
VKRTAGDHAGRRRRLGLKHRQRTAEVGHRRIRHGYRRDQRLRVGVTCP